MHCPFCGTIDTRVIDSRLVSEENQVKRRRECVNCKQRFNTYEKSDVYLPRIIKRDGSRELFREDKLRAGLTLALQKRPIATSAIVQIINHIKQQLLQQATEKEISSAKIGEWAMQQLCKVDEVAYIRFASVYKRFATIDEFKAIIDQMSG